MCQTTKNEKTTTKSPALEWTTAEATEGGRGLYIFYWPNLCPRFCCFKNIKMFTLHGAYAMYDHREAVKSNVILLLKKTLRPAKDKHQAPTH